ncbi:hypothetical protein BH09MYX1_BH09MYX1_47250 [soil metagenome]
MAAAVPPVGVLAMLVGHCAELAMIAVLPLMAVGLVAVVPDVLRTITATILRGGRHARSRRPKPRRSVDAPWLRYKDQAGQPWNGRSP